MLTAITLIEWHQRNTYILLTAKTRIIAERRILGSRQHFICETLEEAGRERDMGDDEEIKQKSTKIIEEDFQCYVSRQIEINTLIK